MIIHNHKDIRLVVNETRKKRGMQWKELSDKSGICFGTMKNWEYKDMRLATAILALETLGLELVARNKTKGTELVPREALLKGFGHGWEETWYIGDDEDPERKEIYECVWLNGVLLVDQLGFGAADSAYWDKNYGKKYGMRVWAGVEQPTEEQRRETPWADT